MKNLRRAIGITVFFAQLFWTIPPGTAVTKVEFFCAPNENMFPTTYIRISGRKKPLELVTWKSTPKNKANEKRCTTALKRFNDAWKNDSFDQLVAGKDNNGFGLICALSYRDKECDRSHSLFTLNTAREAQDIIDQLKSKMDGQGTSSPIYQGSARSTIDMKQLLQQAAAKNK